MRRSRTIFAVVAVATVTVCVPRAGAAPDDPAVGLVVEDLFGRRINTRGLTLVDWEGHIANPAVKFFLRPPPGTAFPAKAVLTAASPRLYFDLPSTAGPTGPRKEVTFTRPGPAAVYVSIFPDRDGADEDHSLAVVFTDAGGRAETVTVPVRVVDQDRDRPEEFAVRVDYSQDKTGFFADEKKRATVARAARDWAYFIGDMHLAPVPAGAEETFVWGPDGFKSGRRVTNAGAYTGYLLYAYGVRGDELRSGGEPSADGGFQVGDGIALPVRRSGGLEVEVRGNYNTKGWAVDDADDDWWRATNLPGVPNDLYSITHHEIGHALIFNPANRRVRRGEPLRDDRLAAYLGAAPRVADTDHLDGVVDPASRRGAFGNEYHGRMPQGRWLITKTDLLCARAAGYTLRETSAFAPVAVATAGLPAGRVGVAYSAKLRATGGVPFYHWEAETGLPPGLTLDSFTGEVTGVPREPGAYEVAVRLRDYTEGTAGVTRRLRLVVESR